ncbi:MAG TPA: beta-galactosidase GalA, partial [Thermoanaerobaculia bacterium]|nr:beta-galactosidase GalA [Thermoanaerobaculia bacterium]
MKAVRLGALGLLLGVFGAEAGARSAVDAPGAALDLQRSTPREELLLDTGWRFHLGSAVSLERDFGFGTEATFAKAGTASGPAQQNFDDSGWRTVTLPHDWAVELDFVRVDAEDVRSHGYKPVGRQFPDTSVGWYRRSFTVAESDRGKRLELRFEGVMRDAMVWLNGHYLGRNASGYGEFGFDLTDYLRYGHRNVVVVRADASQHEGWFYEGAGIYRHVWLVKVAPVHVPLHGTFVTSEVETESAPERAQVHVETTIANDAETAADPTLVSAIVDEHGEVVASSVAAVGPIAPYGEQNVQQTIAVARPELWSLESPHLYRLVSLVAQGATALDRTETVFGIRTIRFDPERGFFLNGKPVKIKGVCCHQDHAGVGAALPDRLQEYRLERLAEMGANAYRTSHHPPAPELLAACDRLGILVMDENRLMGSAPEVQDQVRRLVRRDRNHPSVILWSLGNEEWSMQSTETGAAIARTLAREVRRLDPTRPITYGGDNGEHWAGINSVVDVRGVNYLGRGDVDAYHRQHPQQPVLGSEEASTYCTRGVYARDEANGYVTDYDAEAPGYGSLADRWWKFAVARPWLAGAFVWTGFDYRGEPSPFSWPCISSHFGVMDTCGFPKNNFYYYQAWWSDRDVLHVAPHWNWKGREGQPIVVRVDSNADEVELLLNGKSLGRKRVEPNEHLLWTVPYQPGTLLARGRRGGRLLTAAVVTTGRPAAVVLTPDRGTIRADGEDLSIVNVSVRDQQGREVPDADSLIHFTVTGGATILGTGNGNPSSHEADTCVDGGCQRRLFSGRAQVIVRGSR